MQANDAQTQGRGSDPRPTFALDFRANGVALMRRECGVATMARGRRFSVTQRPGGAWSEIAFCDWLTPKADGEAAALDAPERLIASLGDAPRKVDVWLPAEIVLSRVVEDASAGADEPAERLAARAISGLTILRPDALEIAAIRTGTGVAFRAVERSVLAEVSAHVRRWGFAIRSVRSRPGDREFPDGAVFANAAPGRAGQIRKLGGARPGALGLVGGAAALAAAAVFLLYGPPDAPPAPDASIQAPARANPAPAFQTLKAEVPFSAPAQQFTPAAAAPEPPAVPAIDESAAPLPIEEAVSIDAGPITIQPTDAPLEIAETEAAPPADPPSPPIDAPAPPPRDEAAELAALAPLREVVVDAVAGEAGTEVAAPGDSTLPEGEPAPPEARRPASRRPSTPPVKPRGLEEMGDADFAALTLEEAAVPKAPPAPVHHPKNPPPPAPRPAMRPGATPEEPLKPAGEAEDRIPVSDLAPETARPPKPRPKAVADLAAEEAPVEITSLAPESAAPPRPRPAHIRELPAKLKAAAERAKAERPAKATERRGAPTAAVIAEAATQHMEWETLDGFILIGVFERAGGRSALMRLPNGDVRRVAVGDRIGRWTVASLSGSAVSLKFEGETQTLHLPGVN